MEDLDDFIVPDDEEVEYFEPDPQLRRSKSRRSLSRVSTRHIETILRAF